MSTCLWHRVFENEAGGEGGGVSLVGWLCKNGRISWCLLVDTSTVSVLTFVMAPRHFFPMRHALEQTRTRWPNLLVGGE